MKKDISSAARTTYIKPVTYISIMFQAFYFQIVTLLMGLRLGNDILDPYSNQKTFACRVLY